MSSQDMALNKYWTPVYNIFNPAQPVWGPALEPCYVEREDSPLSTLIFALRPDRVSQKILFTGQRGSGKSSALARLIRTLGKDYLVVWIDLYTSLDIWNHSLLELLLALGGGIYKVAQSADLRPNPQPWEDMVGALSTLIGQTLRQPEYKLDAEGLLRNLICARGDPMVPLDLGADIPTMRFSLDLAKVELERLRVGPVLRETVGRINAIIADAEAKAGYNLLVMVDGLDKMPWIEAQSVFEYSSALAEVRCRTVYTLPYGLYKTRGFSRREYFDIYELPNVKLHAQGEREELHEPGFEVMRQVVRLRLETLGMEMENVITTNALDKLIWGSGGVMRALIKLMRSAAIEAETHGKTRIDTWVAERALQIDQRGRSAGLSDTTLDYLRSFEETGHLEEERLFLLEDGNVVAYQDKGRIWYAVHPNVLPLLEG